MTFPRDPGYPYEDDPKQRQPEKFVPNLASDPRPVGFQGRNRFSQTAMDKAHADALALNDTYDAITEAVDVFARREWMQLGQVVDDMRANGTWVAFYPGPGVER